MHISHWLSILAIEWFDWIRINENVTLMCSISWLKCSTLNWLTIIKLGLNSTTFCHTLTKIENYYDENCWFAGNNPFQKLIVLKKMHLFNAGHLFRTKVCVLVCAWITYQFFFDEMRWFRSSTFFIGNELKWISHLMHLTRQKWKYVQPPSKRPPSHPFHSV